MDRFSALSRITQSLSQKLAKLNFTPPVCHVYNPLIYARKPHLEYLKRYAVTTKRVIYLGMNPGPYGMAQTGIPFGEITFVRDWLGIVGKVDKPKKEHPKRLIQGFACRKSEVSGARLWGAFRDRYHEPSRFFENHFVANYCPLVFMEQSGRNRTPDKLPEREKTPLYRACDQYLINLVELLEPQWVIGIGKFAEQRATSVLIDSGVKVGYILHPSPANPKANRDWAKSANAQLHLIGLEL